MAQAPRLPWLVSISSPRSCVKRARPFCFRLPSASPGALGCWQAGSPVIWRNLLVSMVTVTHWCGRSRKEREAGSVSFPQPLAPCGTGMSAVS